jgi:hypothetical protein
MPVSQMLQLRLHGSSKALILAIYKLAGDVAERVGFEPTVEFPQHTLSKRAP